MGDTTHISEFVAAAIGDPAPPPEAPVVVPLPPQPAEDESPVAQARTATVEQTGADPPPEG